jgi:hypothetical protein
MRYVKIENGVPTLYTFNQLKQDNPNVSFPREPSASILADYGVYILQDDPKPRAEVVEKGPIEERNGEWWQTYTGRDETPDEYRPDMVVTMRQARLALVERGLLGLVQDAIALIPEPDKTKIQIEWEYASEVARTSSWVSVLQPALGVTDEQMDDLFKLAGTL